MCILLRYSDNYLEFWANAQNAPILPRNSGQIFLGAPIFGAENQVEKTSMDSGLTSRGVYSSGTFDSFPPLLGALILFPLQKLLNLACTGELLYNWSKETLNA